MFSTTQNCLKGSWVQSDKDRFCKILQSVLLLSVKFEYKEGLLLSLLMGTHDLGKEGRKKVVDCLFWQLRVENSSVAICGSTWVTVKNKVRHVYKNSRQFQNFIFSIIRVDISLSDLPCKVLPLVPLWSQTERSVLAGTRVGMTVFADKHTGDFWQKPGYWSITMP